MAQAIRVNIFCKYSKETWDNHRSNKYAINDRRLGDSRVGDSSIGDSSIDKV